MVWIVGEYSDRIENAEELLAMFLETFPEEPPVVQLQLLTATVKLFLRKPTEGPQTMIQLVLSNATSETDNPDLRDRAYIYWRLLSTDPEVAKDVVLSEMPVISAEGERTEPALLTELLGQIGTLASVFHRPQASFVTRQRLAVQHVDEIGEGVVAEEEAAEDAVMQAEVSQASSGPVTHAQPSGLDLLDLGGGAPAAPAASAGGDLLGDLMGGPAAPAAAAQPAAPPPRAQLPLVLDAARGRGLEVRAAVARGPSGPIIDLSFTNKAAGPLDGFMVQLNKASRAGGSHS